MLPAGEDTQEAQQLPQNNDNDHEEEEEDNEEKEEGNKAKSKDDEDYNPLRDVEKEETYHDADEIKTFRNKAPIPTGRLKDLLN
jgi:hypothetical protein